MSVNNLQTKFDSDLLVIGKGLEDTIKCNICYSIDVNPKQLKCCGKLICLDCFEDWKAKNDTCPVFGTENPEIIEIDKTVRSIFDTLTFKCEKYNVGCKVSGISYQDLNKHKNVCKYYGNGYGHKIINLSLHKQGQMVIDMKEMLRIMYFMEKVL